MSDFPKRGCLLPSCCLCKSVSSTFRLKFPLRLNCFHFVMHRSQTVLFILGNSVSQSCSSSAGISIILYVKNLNETCDPHSSLILIYKYELMLCIIFIVRISCRFISFQKVKMKMSWMFILWSWNKLNNNKSTRLKHFIIAVNDNDVAKCCHQTGKYWALWRKRPTTCIYAVKCVGTTIVILSMSPLIVVAAIKRIYISKINLGAQFIFEVAWCFII